MEVAGLTEVPTPGVALAAVPGLEHARPRTRSSLPGARATGCGPFRLRKDEEGKLEIYTARDCVIVGTGT
jgi:hypothetical protein